MNKINRKTLTTVFIFIVTLSFAVNLPVSVFGAENIDPLINDALVAPDVPRGFYPNAKVNEPGYYESARSVGSAKTTYASDTVTVIARAHGVWSAPTQLTNNTASDMVPSISGDGSKIAFYSDVDGDLEIYVTAFTESAQATTFLSRFLRIL